MDNELHGIGLGKSAGEPSANTRRSFRILIAYDTPINALEAMRLADGMVGQLGEEFEIHRDLWRFDILTLPEIRDDAVRETLDADLVVIAADAERSLPVPVKDWLTAWAARCVPGDGILVALLNVRLAMPAQAGELRFFLRSYADQTGIELFCREFIKSPGEVKGAAANFKQRVRQPSAIPPGDQRCN